MLFWWFVFFFKKTSKVVLSEASLALEELSSFSIGCEMKCDMGLFARPATRKQRRRQSEVEEGTEKTSNCAELTAATV